MRQRARFLPLCFFLGLVCTVHGQEFVTPSAYLDEASKIFGSIQDYQAEIRIVQRSGDDEGDPMVGALYYKTPDRLRIDFRSPKEQVLVVDDDLLTVYVPRYSYILEQKLQRRSDSSVALMASNRELGYLKNNYSVAYSIGPDPVPLDEGSTELVIKLKFQSLSSNEGFSQLEIAFDENKMIRRVTGFSGAKTLVMNYRDIKINQDIPDAQFRYEAPASANVFRNFLFEVGE